MPLELLSRQVRGLCKSVTSIRCCTVQLRCWLFPSSDSSTFSGRLTGWPRNSYLLKFQVALFFGWWPTFRFLKGGIPRAYPAWDRWIQRMLARSCLSVGIGEDEKEARRCMSPRLPTFAKTKAQRWATRPWCLRKRMVPSIMCVRENGSCWQARSTLGTFGWLRGVGLNHRPLGCLTKPSIMGCISCAAETTRYN